MKSIRSLLFLATVLLSTTVYAQNSLYEKFSRIQNVSAVYISKAMLGMQPHLSAMGQVNISKVAGQLDGVYILNTSAPNVQVELEKDIDKYIKQGKHELLMEQKGTPGYSSAFYIKRKNNDIIKELIMITERTSTYSVGTSSNLRGTSSQRTPTTQVKLVILTGAMTLKDIQSITESGMRSSTPYYYGITSSSIPKIGTGIPYGFTSTEDFKKYLDKYPKEWRKLDSLNRISPRILDDLRKIHPQLDSLLRTYPR